MACGIPSIYSNWVGQLQFAKHKGLPVKIKGLIDAEIKNEKIGGEYCEPDFTDLASVMRESYNNYNFHKENAMEDSVEIRENFNWNRVANLASKILEKRMDDITDIEYLETNMLKIPEEFVFVTTGDIGYMPVIEKLVHSILEFSNSKIIVYGVDCDVPFDYPNLIKRRIDPPKRSEHDKWYWKQYACIESTKEGYEHFVWIDGDAVISYNFDNIKKYFKEIENYPISDIHINEEFFGMYEHDGKEESQLFNERVSELWGIKRPQIPIMHICMYIYNKKCDWWFQEIIDEYNAIDLKDYKKYFLWNDEGVDNVLRWKYNFQKHLPVSNFDTSSYDGDFGDTNETLHQFYKFWNEDGPQNFNRIYGYQFIPEDKSDIIYFHGNKDTDISQKMVEFIRLQRDGNFHQSFSFYTGKYKIENFDHVYGILGGTYDVAMKYGWPSAIFHEIYNLKDYYHNRKKMIHDGDIVVDVGGNIGVFTRCAYQEGASNVISFEPDRRYFELLKLNSDPRTILFNAAVSDNIGKIRIYESSHLGGTTIFDEGSEVDSYDVRSYTLDHLFETKLVDKIDFLKVDIEGAEIKAFEGISDENLRKVKTIGMEYHHRALKYDEELRSNLINRLNSLGFDSHLSFLGDNKELQMIYFTKMETANTLDAIANLHGTDKSYFMHNYCVKYEKYLPFNRDDELKIMEIGVLRGESVKMWRDYFHKSQIVGIDITPECKQYEEERISIEIGSQSDGGFLDGVVEKHGPFDMIIDDGSHMNLDVIFSFEHLFNSIKSGGVYIIEDCATSYWNDFDGGFREEGTSIEHCKNLVDDVNFNGLEYDTNGKFHRYRKESDMIPFSLESQPSCRVDIESINFLNGIIIITKR